MKVFRKMLLLLWVLCISFGVVACSEMEENNIQDNGLNEQGTNETDKSINVLPPGNEDHVNDPSTESTDPLLNL